MNSRTQSTAIKQATSVIIGIARRARKLGLSYRDIGFLLGMSGQGAHDLLTRR